MDTITAMYDLIDYHLPNGITVAQVISKKGAP
jgi:hypothetical protein